MATDFSNRKELIDDLINNLFVLDPENEETNESIGDLRLNPNVSLTLMFMFPAQVYLRAIESLDSKSVTVYRYQNETRQQDTGFSFEEMSNDCIIIVDGVVSDEKLENGVVDIDDWLCSCTAYANSFSNCKVQIETNENNRIGYGTRRGFTHQFKDQEDNKIPICQHLLTCYILKKHHAKLSNSYTLKGIQRDEWLDIHSKIIHNTS